jgi:hypothetical protein
MREPQNLPFLITPGEDDPEIAALIESWRFRGPSIGWDAVVGHTPQIRRCQEVVEALRRPQAELDRLPRSSRMISGSCSSGRRAFMCAIVRARRDAYVVTA